MRDKGLVSIIIPVYNAQEYLDDCIKSVLGQTYKNFEVILIDDGSLDKSLKICNGYSEWDNRIIVIYKENGGVSSARNMGLDVAKGEYVLFVDADDYIDEDYIESHINFDADIVVSSTEKSGAYLKSEILKNEGEFVGFGGPVCKLYKRKVIGSTRFREEIKIGEDIIFNLEILKKTENIYYITYDGYHIRYNPNSLTRSHFGRYTERLDEEYQKWWGDTHRKARAELGLKETQANFSNECSVWIYQKIQNLCYKDCPHSFVEKLRRINNQLVNNRERIMEADNPVSPKTHIIVKFCVALRHPIFAYYMFKIINIVKK